MSALYNLQQSFLDHLLESPSSVVTHIQSTVDATAEQRLSIYATGYRLRLKEAITSDFDCLHGYLGDELFDQLMDSYINTYQSQHTSLRYYSQHITELLTTQSPFADYPEVAEIAQIEQSFNHSFDAADCTTIEGDRLADIAAESWPTLHIQLHDSVQLLSFKHNSFSVWKALTEENTPPALEKENSTWLIWRKDLVSRYRALSDAEALALTRTLNGDNFSDLCESLLTYFDEEQTPIKAITYLQRWIGDMMVCGIE